MGPFVQGNCMRVAYTQRISGPEVDQGEGRSVVLKQQLVPSAGRIGPSLGSPDHHRAIMEKRRFDPEGKAEGLMAVEISHSLGKADRIVTSQSNGLPEFTRNQGVVRGSRSGQVAIGKVGNLAFHPFVESQARQGRVALEQCPAEIRIPLIKGLTGFLLSLIHI